MYTKEQLRQKLEDNNFSLDIELVEVYLKDWKIDPVYEDENQIEYFDDLTISKLIQGIILKKQGKNDNDIQNIVHGNIKNIQEVPPKKQAVATAPPPVEIESRTSLEVQAPNNISGGELTNVTLDVTNQTLTLLAETIASKISASISEKVKDSDMFESFVDTGKLKRDNEVLSEQVTKLVDENRRLMAKLNFLQKENQRFKLQNKENAKYYHVFGSFYMKKD